MDNFQLSTSAPNRVLEWGFALPRRLKLVMLLAGDLLAILLSLLAAYLFLYGWSGAVEILTARGWFLFVYMAGCLLLFHLLGFYQRLWRFFTLDELGVVIAGGCAGAVLYGLLTYFLFPLQYSTRILLLNGIFLFLSSGGLRLGVRFARTRRHRSRARAAARSSRRRLLIAGAGEAGRLVLQEIKRNPHIGRVIGLLDDDPEKQGRRFLGHKVLGGLAELEKISRERDAEALLMAFPSVSSALIRDLTFWAKELGLQTMTLPDIRPMLTGDLSRSRIKEVEMKDLLPREPLDLKLEDIRLRFEGRRVLVTGAGGSIGSEICRQVALCEPERLVLLDNSENNLFRIAHELAAEEPGLEFEEVVADVSDVPRIKKLFADYKPEIVLHAAAHKHVPMMEKNPAAALRTNVYGTYNCARAARESGAGLFLSISTDKAVKPSSVMGMSKRVAELLTREFDRRYGEAGETKFLSVRFGNVLGSSGSVVELFEQQIEAGGPVTVTDPRMKRYFMTVGEAVYLVLKSATLAAGGEICILDMGEPVQITELARDMIRLSGFEEEEIGIEIVGQRPGEKLCEELFYPEEREEAYVQERIYRYEGDGGDAGGIIEEVEAQRERFYRGDIGEAEVRELLEELRKGERAEVH